MGTQPHAPAPGPSYEQTRRRFDQSGAAADYAGKHGGHGRDRREQRCIARALAGIERGAAVLDLPCGAGRLAPMLVDMGFAVTEADNSQHMVTQARLAWEGHCLQTKREQTGVRFEVRDVMRTGYADGQFGAVVCNRLLHHFVEPQTRQAALAELRRICCGRVVVSFFNTFALDALRFRAKNWLRGRTPTDRVPIPLRQLKADAQAAGLEFVRALPTRWGVSPQWYAVFAPAGVLHAPPAALPQCAGAESP